MHAILNINIASFFAIKHSFEQTGFTEVEPDWSFAPVRPYSAAPISHTTSVRARSASFERRKPPSGAHDVTVTRSKANRYDTGYFVHWYMYMYMNVQWLICV